MPVFREDPSRLSLNLSGSSNKVYIKVDCYFGTKVSVSFYLDAVKSLLCGESKELGDAASLKGNHIFFNGAANNPGGGQIKITHTLWEENGESIEYTFPDDYSGAPPWDSTVENPSYEFQVNFL